MSTTYVYWVLMPAGSSTGSSINPIRPPGTQIFKVVAGSTIDQTLSSDTGATVTIAGKKWQPFMVGSFPTQAAAQAASPPSGLAFIGSVVGSATAAGVSAASGTPNPSEVGAGAAAGQSTGQAVQTVGQFLSDLGQPQLWLRIGKVVFGVTLVIVGLVKLTGADQKIGGVAAKAVKFTPFL